MGGHYHFFIYFCFLLLLVLLQDSLAANNSSKTKCNLFQGKWVVDSSYPFYTSSKCPFIDAQFDCQKFSRPDTQYLKYAWKPNSCNLPRFDGKKFLSMWTAKKIMFVGDSISLNMFQSLSCMIYASVPGVKTTFAKIGTVTSLTFQTYGAGVTIYMYRTPYLVDMVTENGSIVLNLNSILGGNTWKSMDMLIFNSFHWYTHTGNSKPWDYIRDGSNLYRDMDPLVAFRKGLTTWAKWVDLNVNTSKTKVFFQGISPTHYRGYKWNQSSKSCSGQLGPLYGSKYPAGSPPASAIVKKVISLIKKPVYLLDITTLSQLRKDGHPSTYSNDPSNNDCSHWCLPGLPDTWNQLLYAALFM